MSNDHQQQEESQTAIACEHMQLHGSAPERGEPDPREVWDEPEALDAIDHIFDKLATVVTPDGTQLSDEREPLLWGLVNVFHAQIRRLDRAGDYLIPKIQDLQHAQQGGDSQARDLEQSTETARNLHDRREAFETMRDAAAEHYAHITGSTWRPRTGSYVSQSRTINSAIVDSRDYIRARAEQHAAAHLPAGELVIVAGIEVTDIDAVWRYLDRVKAKHPKFGIVHGGANKGAEKIAARWAEQNNVPQIVCQPDWTKHGKKAAPIQRNEEMLRLRPIGVIAFPGNGYTENLVRRAIEEGLTVQRVTL